MKKSLDKLSIKHVGMGTAFKGISTLLHKTSFDHIKLTGLHSTHIQIQKQPIGFREKK